MVNLVVPQTADFDLYVYQYDSGQYEEVVLVAKSTQPQVGVNESVILQSGEYLVVVKAVEGEGTFQITLIAVKTVLPLQLVLSLQLLSQQQSNTLRIIIVLSIVGVIGLIVFFLKIRRS